MSCKETLFGIVPDEWTVSTIGEVTELKQGLQISKKLRSEENGEGYIPLLKITDLPSKVFSEYVKDIPEGYIASENDIIYTRTGQVGLVYKGVSGCVHNNCFKVIPNEDLLDREYLYYYLKSNRMFKNSNNIASGSVQKDLTHKAFKTVKIGFPSLIEQKNIGRILSSLDKKIELNNEMNKTLEEMAQALFKRWFVDFEFPNDEGKPYKSSGGEMVESELGMIPKGWSYGIFSDISKRIYSGGTPNTKEESYWNGLSPWMSSGETRNSFVTNTEKSITELGVEKSSTKLARKFNTVIASAGQGFTRGQTSLLLIDTYVNQSLIVIDGCEEFELFNYINIKLRYNELRAISDSHSIRGSLTTKMIATLGTIIPSTEILKRYNSIIEPIIAIIENNIRNINRLIELRDSLLPKLMSGEIRVDNVETDI